jgi:serine/threonine protein kinase
VNPSKLALTRRLTVEGTVEVWVGILDSREVAVKRMPIHARADLETFQKELNLLHVAATRCNNLCKLFGTCTQGDHFLLIMKLYTESLKALLWREGPLSILHVLRYAMQVTQPLVELHAEGITVKDLKPENLLVYAEFDQVVVAKFGISEITTKTLHLPISVKGTHNYMAPEQWAPEVFGDVGNKCYIWCLGATLVHLITGQTPWSGCSMYQIMRRSVDRKETHTVNSYHGVKTELH